VSANTHYGSNLIVIDSSRSAGASLGKQTIAAILQKSATPLANCVFVEAEHGSHILARQAVRTSQNDATSAQIATGQHGDDELASPNSHVPAHSAPPARSAGLSHLHSP
jgi:hypothetical protein